MRKSRDTKGWLRLGIRGMAMGAADLVPGVSGGTVAFISGIYEELLDTIAGLGWGTVRTLFAEGPSAAWHRYNLGFLAALVAGIGLSVALLAGTLHHLLAHHPVLLWSFFFGLVAASVPFMLRDIPRASFSAPIVAALIAGGAIAWWLTGLPPLLQGDAPAFIFGAGAIAICAMILPGISGSFILVLLGAYSAVIGALKSFDVVRIAAFVGGCIAFLWYNAYPAQVFMGDTGSLALGGIIAAFAIAIRKELLLPVLCGIFLIENLSVVLQVGWFKYTKRQTGEGRRIFLMAPLHHHYQKLNIPESKITARFWIIGILLAVVSIVTLKVR